MVDTDSELKSSDAGGFDYLRDSWTPCGLERYLRTGFFVLIGKSISSRCLAVCIRPVILSHYDMLATWYDLAKRYMQHAALLGFGSRQLSARDAS